MPCRGGVMHSDRSVTSSLPYEHLAANCSYGQYDSLPNPAIRSAEGDAVHRFDDLDGDVQVLRLDVGVDGDALPAVVGAPREGEGSGQGAAHTSRRQAVGPRTDAARCERH